MNFASMFVAESRGITIEEAITSEITNAEMKQFHIWFKNHVSTYVVSNEYYEIFDPINICKFSVD